MRPPYSGERTMNPHDLRPMLATAGKPPARYADFAIEAKYDGQRGIAIYRDGTVTLLSRNGADITHTFPEIAAALPATALGRPVVLDGEIVALDAKGVPSFGRLQRRWPQNRRPSAALLKDCPVQFFAFDVLSRDGRATTGHPYVERRALLEALAAEGPSRVFRFPANWTDCDPEVVLAAAAELGLEGIVSKRLDSVYLPGRRSSCWIKTPLRRRSEFVVGGWLPGEGINRHTVGALLVGAYDDGAQLQFCGVVSSGLSAHHRRVLARQLAVLHCERAPFTDAHLGVLAPHVRWVAPALIGDVEYREFNGSLRHASWKGLRQDLSDVGAVLVPAS